MTKRLTCILAALAVLSWTCPTAQAEFKGTLRTDTAVGVEVTSTVNNAGGAAGAVFYVGRELDVEAVFSVPAGTFFAQECSKPGSRVNASSLRWICLWEVAASLESRRAQSRDLKCQSLTPRTVKPTDLCLTSSKILSLIHVAIRSPSRIKLEDTIRPRITNHRY